MSRTMLAVAVAAVALLLTSAPAQAQILVPPAGRCADDGAARVFSRWLDPAHYVLVGDGGFEHGATGWTRSAGATIVDGNEPWHVRSPDDRHALRLGRGARATSPPVCVGLGRPTIRFFARNAGSRLGLLTVQVVVKTSLGPTVALPIGVTANLSRSWSPTLPMPVLVNLLTLLDGSTDVRLRFTAIGLASSWEIDDVYVDPYRKG